MPGRGMPGIRPAVSSAERPLSAARIRGREGRDGLPSVPRGFPGSLELGDLLTACRHGADRVSRGGAGARHDRFRSPAMHTQEPGRMEARSDVVSRRSRKTFGPAHFSESREQLARGMADPPGGAVSPLRRSGHHASATEERRRRHASYAYRDSDRNLSARGLPDALPRIPGRSRVSILGRRECCPCPVRLAMGHLRLRREPAAGRTGAKGALRLIRLSRNSRLRGCARGERRCLTRTVAVVSAKRATMPWRPATSLAEYTRRDSALIPHGGRISSPWGFQRSAKFSRRLSSWRLPFTTKNVRLLHRRQ